MRIAVSNSFQQILRRNKFAMRMRTLLHTQRVSHTLSHTHSYTLSHNFFSISIHRDSESRRDEVNQFEKYFRLITHLSLHPLCLCSSFECHLIVSWTYIHSLYNFKVYQRYQKWPPIVHKWRRITLKLIRRGRYQRVTPTSLRSQSCRISSVLMYQRYQTCPIVRKWRRTTLKVIAKARYQRITPISLSSPRCGIRTALLVQNPMTVLKRTSVSGSQSARDVATTGKKRIWRVSLFRYRRRYHYS